MAFRHMNHPMLARVVVICLALSLPLQAEAESYVVRAGDTLSRIAQQHHISLASLTRANGLTDVNLIQVGRSLFIPARFSRISYHARTYYYHVQRGDTLLGVAAHHSLSLTTIRALNPSLGPYLLWGQWLRLCGPCSSGTRVVRVGSGASSAPGLGAALYVVRLGDTLSGLAARFGISPSAILAANRLVNPDILSVGARLSIPQRSAFYDPSRARAIIVSYAHTFGMSPSLPLAVAWQESGFNQNALSATGAIGVMQVEPYTARHITDLTGRRFNLHLLDDNIHAGVYWLSTLLAYYRGDTRLAIAAYYQGTRSLAKRGFFKDTVQYVNNVLALKATFQN